MTDGHLGNDTKTRHFEKVHDMWRTSHWPSWQTDTSEKIQRRDTLKRSVATCNVHHRQWTTQSTNLMNWRRAVYQTTSSFETRLWANMEDKRRRRKTGTLLTLPLNRPWRAAAVETIAYLGYVSSAISVPAPDEDFLILNLSSRSRAMMITER